MVTRPRKYKSAKAFAEAVDSYFESLQAPMKDKSGKVMCNENGEPFMHFVKPATMTGLALHLGLKSRQAIINYEGYGKEYEDIVNSARMRVEEYCEQRLFDRDGAKGAQFSLRNNFGWVEKQEIGVGTTEEGFSINVKFDE